jgi:hypothetical protein
MAAGMTYAKLTNEGSAVATDVDSTPNAKEDNA